MGILLNLGNTLKVGAVSQSGLSGVLSLQSLVIIPEIGAPIPLLAGQIINNMKSSTLSFDFIPDDAIPFHSDLNSSIGYSRSLIENEKFRITNSGSSIMNLLKLILVCLFIIPLIHFSILVLSRCLSNRSDSWLKKVVNWMKEGLYFNFYISFFMLIYMFLMFATFPEIHDWIDGKDGKLGSRLFSILIFTICLSAIILSGIYWLKYGGIRRVDEDESDTKGTKCSSCFSGLKDSRIHKIHTLVFFVKRFIVCTIIFLLSGVDLTVKISLVLGILLVHLTFIIILRSQTQVSSQISEIVNEAIFSILIVFLFFWVKRSEWNEVGMYLFITIILAKFAIQAIISLCKFYSFILIFRSSTDDIFQKPK